MAHAVKKMNEQASLPANWADVDGILEEMAAGDLEIGIQTASFGVALLKLLGDHTRKVQPLKDMRAQLEVRVEAYCLAHKEEFAKKRSKQFTFGKIAFRVAESIECPKGFEAVVITTLKALGHADCVKVEEEINKNALKDLDDAELARCGLKRHKDDKFRIEPNVQIIADRIGKEYMGDRVSVDTDKLAKLIKCAEGAEIAEGQRG